MQCVRRRRGWVGIVNRNAYAMLQYLVLANDISARRWQQDSEVWRSDQLQSRISLAQNLKWWPSRRPPLPLHLERPAPIKVVSFAGYRLLYRSSHLSVQSKCTADGLYWFLFSQFFAQLFCSIVLVQFGVGESTWKAPESSESTSMLCLNNNLDS